MIFLLIFTELAGDIDKKQSLHRMFDGAKSPVFIGKLSAWHCVKGAPYRHLAELVVGLSR